jgi:transcriptional antiterminator RfaH
VGNQWYVAKSKPRNERLLIASLARWDVDTFFPLVRRGGSESGQLEALFPSYVFCNFDASAPSWHAIRWAPGLAYFLRIEDELTRVDEALIEYLRRKTRVWNEGMPVSRLRQGDEVEVVGGPFAGFSAIFMNYVPARKRCRILLRAVQEVSFVELADSDVELAAGGWRQRFGAAST